MNILLYFQRPFPSREGFSAYRSPGPAAHLPFLLGVALTGIMLCGGDAHLRPLVEIWILAGLFLGRDVAILCHYAPVLLVMIWGAMYAAFTEAHRLALLGQQHPTMAALLTTMVLTLQIGIAWRSTRPER